MGIMKGGACVAAVAIGLLASASSVAQSQQTAQGAQQFLSLLVSEGTVPAALQFAEVRTTVKHRVFHKKALRGWVETKSTTSEWNFPREATVERLSALDACTTNITGLAFSDLDKKAADPADYNDEYATSEMLYEPSPATAMAPPHSIAWGKATVSRGGGGVTARVADNRFKHLTLFYRTTDPELQDRIEYAMKFLQMSCDAAAGTGF